MPDGNALGISRTEGRHRTPNRVTETKSTLPKFDVFLSYRSVDENWVRKLKEDLLQYGVSVWLDQDEIRPGDLFAKALEQGLENSRSVALIVSPEAIASRWVEEEYYRAISLSNTMQKSLQLIPVILRDAKLPGFLQSRNCVDFRDETAYNQNLSKLVWGITGQKPGKPLRDTSGIKTNGLITDSVVPITPQSVKQPIQILMPNSYFDSIPVSLRDAAKKAYAAVLGISPEEITVLHITEGSIVFDLSLPFDAVQRLRSLLQSNSKQLHRLQVQKVVLEGENGQLEEWVLKEGRFQLVPFIRPVISDDIYGKFSEDVNELLADQFLWWFLYLISIPESYRPFVQYLEKVKSKLQLGSVDEAFLESQRAMQVLVLDRQSQLSDDGLFWLFRAGIFFQRGDYEYAQIWAKKAYQYLPNDNNPHRMLAKLIRGNTCLVSGTAINAEAEQMFGEVIHLLEKLELAEAERGSRKKAEIYRSLRERLQQLVCKIQNSERLSDFEEKRVAKVAGRAISDQVDAGRLSDENAVRQAYRSHK